MRQSGFQSLSNLPSMPWSLRLSFLFSTQYFNEFNPFLAGLKQKILSHSFNSTQVFMKLIYGSTEGNSVGTELSILDTARCFCVYERAHVAMCVESSSGVGFVDEYLNN